jgi:hypothetical protein
MTPERKPKVQCSRTSPTSCISGIVRLPKTRVSLSRPERRFGRDLAHRLNQIVSIEVGVVRDLEGYQLIDCDGAFLLSGSLGRHLLANTSGCDATI